MKAFADIAEQYARADAALAEWEQDAYRREDEDEFDRAARARQRNDQAYFLYLFTRFEAEVNVAIRMLLASRASTGVAWSDRRTWQDWARGPVPEIALLAKIELLVDKGGPDYAFAKLTYAGRNTIAHGSEWEAQFFVPDVAARMTDVAGRFARS